MKISISANTDGKGEHTSENRLVIIDKLNIGYSSHEYYPEDPFKGTLNAYFEPSGFGRGSWNVSAYGKIYNDKRWLKEFKSGLRMNGFSTLASRDVNYSAIELQGPDYVSLDVGSKFYASWKRLNKLQSK